MDFSDLLLAVFFGSIIYHFINKFFGKNKPKSAQATSSSSTSTGSKVESKAEEKASPAKILLVLTHNPTYKPAHRFGEIQQKAYVDLLAAVGLTEATVGTTTALPAPPAGDGWEQAEAVETVSVFRRNVDGSAIPMMQGRATIKAPPRAVFRVVTNLENKSQWDKMFKSAENLEELDDYTKVMYVEYERVWPTQPRDFVVLTNVKAEADGTLVLTSISVEHEGKGAVDGRVRGRILMSGWVIKPQAGDTCTVASVSLVDLSGQLPVRVLQKVAANSPLIVAGVKAAAESLSPEDYDFTRISSSSQPAKREEKRPDDRTPSVPAGLLEDRRIIGEEKVKELMEQGERGLRRVLEQCRSKDWEFVGEESGVRLYRKGSPDSPLNSFMGRGNIKASAEQIFKVLKNPKRRGEYDRMLKELRVVRTFTKNAAVVWVHMETRQCLVKQGRDFCVLQYYKAPPSSASATTSSISVDGSDEEFKGKYVISSQSITDPSCPPQPDVTRGEVLCSGWVIEEIARGECQVQVVIQVDFKGNVPPKLVNLVGRKQPLCLYYLREYIEDRVRQ